MEAEVVVYLKLVITGARGLLGSALVSRAREPRGIFPLQSARAIFRDPVHVDLRDRNLIAKTLQEIKPDAIVHAAALTDVDRCEREKDLANTLNHEATKVIANFANDMGVFLVYVSTDYVFDGKRGMYREDDEPKPINFYGFTKLKGEQAVEKLLSNYLIVRASVIYGSTPSSGKVNFALWVLNALKNGDP